MSDKTTPDTVPGLGFKDKDKALDTIKNLEGRDPDYQRLAIKGLIGRAKRTLTLTKAEDKVQNIKDAVSVFEDWLKNFEKLNLGKENRAYLPLATVQTLLALKKQHNIQDKKAEAFLDAYKSAKGDYKNLRTVASAEGSPTWDIVRNNILKKLIKSIDDEKPDLWNDDLPTKEHLEVILWAYSPDASKLKKNLPKLQEKLGKSEDEEEDDDEVIDSESDEDKAPKKKSEKKKSHKRSDSSSSEDDEESPKKKSKK